MNPPTRTDPRPPAQTTISAALGAGQKILGGQRQPVALPRAVVLGRLPRAGVPAPARLAAVEQHRPLRRLRKHLGVGGRRQSPLRFARVVNNVIAVQG